MHFLKYFINDTPDLPKEGVKGKQSPWLDVGDIQVPQGFLWIGDARAPNPSEGLTLNVTPGQYRVQIKGMDFDGNRVPSRVRAYLKSAARPTLGPLAGQTITDCAKVAICDIKELNSIVTKKHQKEFDEDLYATWSESYIAITQFLYGKKHFDMAFTASGFADGAYDVYPLLSKSKPVGLECEFLPDGYVME